MGSSSWSKVVHHVLHLLQIVHLILPFITAAFSRLIILVHIDHLTKQTNQLPHHIVSFIGVPSTVVNNSSCCFLLFSLLLSLPLSTPADCIFDPMVLDV